MWGRSQHEIDAEYGRTEYEKRAESFNNWKRERLMFGTLHGDTELLNAAREYIAAYESARELGGRLAKLLGDRNETVTVRFDGRCFEVQNAVLTSGMPVIVRPATVIGE